MVILLHVLIAISSLIITGYTYVSPSKAKLSVAYSFVAATIISGTYLVLATPSHIVQTCITGLVYLGIVFSGIVLARNKLVREQNRQM